MGNIGVLYNNTQTTYPSAFINKPASYMSGTKYFDSASSWYPSLGQGSSASSNSDFLTNYFMSAMQYGAVKYIPSSPNGNWTQLCQVAAQARSVGYGATRPASDGKEYPNHDFLRKLWRGQVVVPNIGTLYNNTQTTYPSTFMNKPASYMTGTKYFNSASSWYPSLEGSSASSNSDFLTNYFMSAMQ